ncbi:glycosyltransferase family 2 protein [Leuconostoc lactis]|uniref:glycosyltransferase family 2 protein n=1 Tax=Leuconostoc lactis TaxID=1246 RepID=UPI0024AD90BF|nr:glycosyltransferase family 2 protein [Leuconostoc lactis]MDI6496226.1 glycosyltransferase family 2 protein [Leuconostoc lactis]
MSNNKLSIILPAYNVTDTIERAIDSALKLSDILDKIIIVDDHSTDNLKEFLTKKYGTNNSKLKYILGRGKGAGDARNTGLSYVECQYVMFLDGDDFLSNQDKIRSHFLQIDDEDIIVFSKNIQSDGELNREQAIYSNLGLEKQNEYDSGPVSKIFKVKTIREANAVFPSNIKIGEDMVFNLKVILSSKNIKIINQPIYNVTYNVHSITRSIDFYSFYSDRINLTREVLKILMKTDYENFINSFILKNYVMIVVGSSRTKQFDINIANMLVNFKSQFNVSFYRGLPFLKEYFGLLKTCVVILAWFFPRIGVRIFRFIYLLFRNKKKIDII